ncbi:unnamed protein product [Psylliodes chrysocephalus]|uniref:Regulatory protein zeste n=1 Tax=Psylliodes chrysocephalus TaxID=3402493 RepID=A0A9P0DDB5_9CUCU|nr:unnamed protein product [Psylliodes chrysocephala]
MKVRTDQCDLLLTMAENTPELITNKFNGIAGKAKGHAMWQTLANILNDLGFGEKTTAEWRRALTDWKSKTKAKAAKLRMAQEGTGGGLSTALPLTDYEKRLLSLMGNFAVEGDGE